MIKCTKCGETKLRTRGGQIFCKNGHSITIIGRHRIDSLEDSLNQDLIADMSETNRKS